MNVGSLFSGIGGLDLGLARAGHTHRFFCESDPYRRAVLARHWPGVPVYEDVSDLARERTEQLKPDDECRDARDPRQPRAGQGSERPRGERGRDGLHAGRDGSASGGDEPAGPRGGSAAGDGRSGERQSSCGRVVEELSIDLLCGGFPCQDLSVAGRRRGLAGERSGLFFEFARIADALRPEWLLIENVPGLLSSHGGRDFGELLGTLADLGYGVAWRILDSRFFGVPQRRRRVFIVGNDAGGRAGAERAGEVLSVGSGCSWHLATRGQEGPRVAASLSRGSSSPGTSAPGRRQEDDENIVTRTLQGGRSRGNDEEAGYGPLIPEVADPLVARSSRGKPTPLAPGHNTDGHVVVAHALTSEGHDASEDGTGRGTPLTVAGAIGGGHYGTGRRTEDDPNLVTKDIVNALDSMQGGADDNTAQAGQLVAVSENQWAEVLETPISHQLTSGGGKPGQGYPAVRDGAMVRRLTPTECERLQSLPDGWTLLEESSEPNPKPDSPRYAACGDAVTASVGEWIGRRFAEVGQESVDPTSRAA